MTAHWAPLACKSCAVYDRAYSKNDYVTSLCANIEDGESELKSVLLLVADCNITIVLSHSPGYSHALF